MHTPLLPPPDPAAKQRARIRFRLSLGLESPVADWPGEL